jgi:Ala-tRNA(Pro) deacylase
MKTRTDLFSYFDQLGIAAQTYEHKPLFKVGETDEVADAIPGVHIKNLFLKGEGDQFWLLVAEQHAKIELKKVMLALNIRKLRFADADHLLHYIGVTPGSVTPFGLINDPEHKVRVILDHSLFDHAMINAHPLENNATTSISLEDFKKFLRATGHQPMIINLADYTVSDL